jgi:hypothetical protein
MRFGVGAMSNESLRGAWKSLNKATLSGGKGGRGDNEPAAPRKG